MKTKSFFLLLMFFSLTLNGYSQLFKKVKGNDKYITKEYKVDDFVKVNISNSFNVIYKVNPDSAGVIKVYGEENILDLMSVKSEKGTLTMKLKGAIDPEFGVILIHMYSKNLVSVKNEGSGTFEINSPIEGAELKFSISGSGQIKAEDIKCGVIDVNLGGSGDFYAKGSTGFASYSLQGSGEIRCEDLQAETSNITITGNGCVKCAVSKELKSFLTGSGKIFYKGEPEIKSRTIGTGQLVKL
jgi:Protein of unknown function (DUF2807).